VWPGTSSQDSGTCDFCVSHFNISTVSYLFARQSIWFAETIWKTGVVYSIHHANDDESSSVCDAGSYVIFINLLQILSSTYLRHAYAGGKFMHKYTGPFLRKVAYTRYDVPWFIEWMYFTQFRKHLSPRGRYSLEEHSAYQKNHSTLDGWMSRQELTINRSV
jgi:hypothetical protein